MACMTGLLHNLFWRSFLHLYSKILRFLTIFEKKSLKAFATSVSLDSILSLLTKIIASLHLILKKIRFDGMSKFYIVGDCFLIKFYKVFFFLSQKGNTVVSLFAIENFV